MKKHFYALGLALFFYSASVYAEAAKPYDFARSGDMFIRADTLLYDQPKGLIEASGGVEVAHGDNILKASRIVFDEARRQVEAFGPLHLRDGSGVQIFARSARLQSDLSEGELEYFTLLFPDGSRLVAGGAVRQASPAGDALFNAAYTPCDTCANQSEDPSWDFQADYVFYDREGQRVYYRNAVMRLFGLPVFYLPFFWHPGPEVERQTGFLIPRIGFSDYLGANLAMPFLVNISPASDLRLTPVISEKNRSSLHAHLRQGILGGLMDLTGSVAQEETPGIGRTRSHLFGRGRFPFGTYGVWGFDVQTTSDDTYLRLYDISDDLNLVSRLFGEWAFGGTAISLALTRYENLLQLEAEEKKLLTLPVFSLLHRLPNPVFGGNLRAQLNFSALDREAGGQDYRRFSAGLEWERFFFESLGSVWHVYARLRGDLFVLKEVDAEKAGTDIIERTYESRLSPLLGLEWRYPLIRHGAFSSQVIEPVIHLVIAPWRGADENLLPNEDSPAPELGRHSLLQFERFSGFDRIEAGPRLHFGVNVDVLGYGGGRLSAFLGQGVRFRSSEEGEAQAIRGFERSTSDYIAALSLGWPDVGELNYRLRLDGENGTINQYEVDADLHIGVVGFFADYTRLIAEESLSGTEEEEIYLGSAMQVTRNWRLYGEWRYDLANNRSAGQRGGVRYQDNCISFDIIYEHDFTRDRDIEPDSRITFRLALRNFGDRGVSASLGDSSGASFE